jgi:UDP-N-acetylmuramyl pentapeptide phosphotransferase/UDP-N-acetylglucosamine-1-phosphate transferase
MTFLISFVLNFLMRFLPIIDKPSERSSHNTPTPRSGGIAIAISFLCGIYMMNQSYLPPYYHTLMGGLILCGVSILDDIRHLSQKIRLFVHIVSAFLMTQDGLYVIFPLMEQTPIMMGIEMGITIIGIVFLINACNFMDGLNGLLSGLFLIHGIFLGINQYLFPTPMSIYVMSILIVIFQSVLAFFWFNYRPFFDKKRALLFLGDCGSTLIGYMIALLSLMTQLKQHDYIHWISPHFIASLLPLSLIWVDVISTLMRRVFYKRGLTEPHQDYFFHLLYKAGYAHKTISCMYFGVTTVMGMLTIYYSFHQQNLWQILIVGAMVIGGFVKFIIKTARANDIPL